MRDPQLIKPMNSYPEPEWIRPQALPSLETHDIHIWRVNLENALPDALDAKEILSPKEQDRAKRFQHHAARCAFVTGRGILRILLGHYMDLAPRDVPITPSSHGKPQCLTACSNISFNLSHSGHLILLGLGRARPLGIDVEHLDRNIPYLPLAKRFFAEKEASELATCQDQDRQRLFFDIWVRKEAYIKALGLGLSLSLQDFTVPMGFERLVVSDPGPPGLSGPMVFYGFSPGPGALAALVTAPPIPRLKHLEWSLPLLSGWS